MAQSDLKLVVGGLFTQYQNEASNRIVRLNPDGSRDDGFSTGTGANAGVYEVVVQPDGKILLGGNFNEFNGLNKNGVVRLKRDGNVDPTINFGSGANGSVLAIALRFDYKLILGGGFTEFNNEPREHIVQIHGGIIRTPGRLQFNFPRYFVNEKGTNATVQVIRTGGLIGDIGVNFKTVDDDSFGGADDGLDYVAVNKELTFPEGEAIQNVAIDILDDIEIESDE